MSIPWKFEMSSPFNANDQIYRPLLLADWPAPFHGSDLPKTWVIWIEIYTFGLYLFVKCQPRCSKKNRAEVSSSKNTTLRQTPCWSSSKRIEPMSCQTGHIFYQPKGMTRGFQVTCYPNTVRFASGRYDWKTRTIPTWLMGRTIFMSNAPIFWAKNHGPLISTIFERMSMDVYGGRPVLII